MTHDEPTAETTAPAELVELAQAVEPKPWGFWATMAYSLAVIIVFVAIQTVVTGGFVIGQSSATPNIGDHDIEELASSGLLLSVAEWVSAPLGLALVMLLVKLRKQLSMRDYLALNRVSGRRLLVWTSIILLFVVVSDGTTWLLGRDLVPEIMVKAYRTAVVVPLLWTAIVVAAPLFEELFFRGFMFRGIQQSRLGNIGAVLITSFIWSIIHIQYDVYELAVIFLGGILLGIARARSNSTYLTIVMHSTMNLIATSELLFFA
jgi:uncharacterized protein